jgi:hypothetical protein
MLPEQLQLVLRSYVADARRFDKLDRQVDAFLLAAHKEDIHGYFDISLGLMLEKLEARRTHLFQYGHAAGSIIEELSAADVSGSE